MTEQNAERVQQPPATKYLLTVTVRGNSHDEIEGELLAFTRGGYLLDSDYHKRDEFHCIGGRVTARLEHTNPDQTPENYRAELDAWSQARKEADRG